MDTHTRTTTMTGSALRKHEYEELFIHKFQVLGELNSGLISDPSV